MAKKSKINIPKDQMKKCNAIIHGASVAAGGVGTGMAQIPLADNTIITPIQIGMIIALGKVFDQRVSKSAATAILGSMAASFVGRGVSQVLVGWIPFFGNAINTATAAGLTETIGWVVVDNFSKNQYSSILNDYPVTDEEMEEDLERTKALQEKNLLIVRAEEFISGGKNKKDNKEEFYILLNDIEKILCFIPEEDPLYDLYDKLMDIK